MKEATKAIVNVATLSQVRARLAGSPAIFLSASVPYERKRPEKVSVAEWAPRARRNRQYLASAEPAKVRSAVVAMTRAMLKRGCRLVFGAHPAISPMVLSAASDMQAPPASILIFQSAYFRPVLPKSTLHLASWDAGRLVMTPEVRDKSGLDHKIRDASLSLMRKLMVSVPNLRCGIFVGGMEGVEEEARAFRSANPKLPVYALASTGSEARNLWRAQPRDFSGSLDDPAILDEHPSYTEVARQIFSDFIVK